MKIEVPERSSSKFALKGVPAGSRALRGAKSPQKTPPVLDPFWDSKSTPNLGTLFEALLAPLGPPWERILEPMCPKRVPKWLQNGHFFERPDLPKV